MANSSFFAPAGDSPAGMELAAAVRNAQIVVGAVSVGAMSFLIVALVARREGLGPQAAARNAPIVTYTALATSASCIVALAVVPGLIVGAGRRQINRQLQETAAPDRVAPDRVVEARSRLAGLFLRKSIVAAAIAEGAAFLAILAVMIEGHPIALVVAAVMIALVIWQFPSQLSAERWIDEQGQRLADEGRG